MRRPPRRLLASGGLQPEPVSPELVLVDPELAERERARLQEKARLATLLDVETLRRVVEWDADGWQDDGPSPVRRDVRRFARSKLLPGVLLCSLLANGFLVAAVVVRSDGQHAIEAQPAAASSAAVLQPSTSTRNVLGAQTKLLPQRAMVERQLVSLILRAPARKLPRTFIDPATGLVRNNVNVTCRRAQSRSYLCAVQLSSADSNGGILVRYRRGRGSKGVFTWYGYKRNVGTMRFLQSRKQLRAEKTN